MLYLAGEDYAGMAARLTTMTKREWLTEVLAGKACPEVPADDGNRLQHAKAVAAGRPSAGH